MDGTTIRPVDVHDPPIISTAFAAIGWDKRESQYRRYLEEQAAGIRLCWVALREALFAGYVTLLWHPTYESFREAGIPEIQDLNVLPQFRRRGIASMLVDLAERVAAERADQVGIGFGLHPGYNAAQRMYVLRGYVPDGRGVTYRDVPVAEGQTLPFDDDLVLHLTKRLR